MVRDSLTGLYNHTHILQLLEDCSFRARRENKPLSFAMLDIDHFKRVNDSHGHPMGDRVIKSLALFLKQRLRKTDFIGRYGGEEFAIVMPDTDIEAAHKLLDRDPPALRRNPLPGATARFVVHLQRRRGGNARGVRQPDDGQPGRRSAVPRQGCRTQSSTNRARPKAKCHLFIGIHRFGHNPVTEPQ